MEIGLFYYLLLALPVGQHSPSRMAFGDIIVVPDSAKLLHAELLVHLTCTLFEPVPLAWIDQVDGTTHLIELQLQVLTHQ